MFDKARTPTTPPRRTEPGARRRAGSTSASIRARRDRFVVEYMKDLNGTRAAIRAGFARNGAHVTAHRLLSDANVSAAIARKHEAILQDLEVSAKRVIAELALISFVNVKDILRIDARGQIEIDLEALDQGAAAAIREVRDTTKTVVSKTGVTRTTRCVTIRLADKTAALALLGKHFGLF
jgi:phage terminase small subunit